MANPIKFNKKRAIKICDVVLDAHQDRKKLFAQPGIEEKMFPEKQIISVLPVEKQALWLFFSCPGDKMIDSVRYYQQFKDFYLSHQNFFDSKNLRHYNSFGEDLKEFVWKVKVAIPREFIRFTLHNSEKLISEFDNNPIKVLENNHQESVKNLKQFLGYGKELASLYLIFLTRYSIKQVEGLVPKIDRHLLRISVGCGIASIEDGVRVDKLVNELSKFYEGICHEQKLDVLSLDPAMYVIGHEICSKKDKVGCKLFCPLDDYCSKDLPIINRKDTRLYKRPSKLNQLIFDLN